MVLSFFKWLSQLGVVGPVGAPENRRVVLANQICILLGGSASVYFFIFLIAGYTVLATLIVPTAGILFVCPFLNYFGYSRLASFLIIFDSNLAIFFYSCSLGRDCNVQSLYFALTAVPIVLFPNGKISWALALLTPMSLLFVSEWIDYSLFSRVYPSAIVVQSVFFTVTLISFLIIAATVYFYMNLREQAEIKLLRSIGDLELAYRDLKESRSAQEEMAVQAGYAELVRGIAHEIKNPLAMIQTRAEIVQRHLEDPVQVMRFSEMLQRNIVRLSDLLKPMLEYSTYRRLPSHGPFQLDELMDDLDVLVQPRATAQGIELTVSGSRGIVLLGDHNFIFQALLNLVTNSLQYTPKGGRISIAYHKANYVDPSDRSRRGAQIAVTDTGCGIPEKNLGKIFTPYFTTKATSSNVGLGLPLVFRVITENEGLVRIDSTEGEGTVVTIHLPVQDEGIE